MQIEIKTAASPVVAIVIHAFYEDVFAEILEQLKGSDALPMKLYVTTPPENEESIRKLLVSQPCDFLLRAVENRGRDVLPFMKILPEVLGAGHRFLVKIHTKKSLHRNNGMEWRRDMFSSLIGGSSTANAIRFLGDNPHVGILGPAGHLVSMGYFFGRNKARVTQLAARMGVGSGELSGLSFVAGSMFVARVDAMRPLLSLGLSDSDFEPELGQVDGTLAHAIERLFSVSAYSVNLSTTCADNVALTKYGYARARLAGRLGVILSYLSRRFATRLSPQFKNRIRKGFELLGIKL